MASAKMGPKVFWKDVKALDLDYVRFCPECKSKSEAVFEIDCPADTPFAGGVIKLQIGSFRKYPLQPPKVKCLTSIFHPNINQKGMICIALLAGEWDKRKARIIDLFEDFIDVLKTPMPDSGIFAEALALFIHEKEEYIAKAKEWTQLYAMKAVQTQAKDSDKNEENRDDEKVHTYYTQFLISFLIISAFFVSFFLVVWFCVWYFFSYFCKRARHV